MKFMQIEPQPARGVLREEMWDDPDWIAEEKYDGDRRIAQFCGKVVRFTGRRKSVKDGLFVEKTENVPHLSAAGFRHNGRMTATECATRPPPSSLDGTVLDGEMVINPENMPDMEVDGGRSKYVTSIMGSLPEEAIRKQIERGWLRYVVFDCLFYGGKDVRGEFLCDRRKKARAAVDEWGNPHAMMAQQYVRNLRGEYNEIVSRGGEGVILKHVGHLYGAKTGWVKVKKIATYDVVIIGFKAAKETSKKVNGEVSTAKYAGKVGSVEIGQFVPSPNGPRAVVMSVGFARGFSDRLMDEFTRHPKKYLGRVIEVEANDREPSGKFRHPRVTHPENPFRDDKAARDCIYRKEEC
jgi:ATP-dependent DNA ligase